MPTTAGDIPAAISLDPSGDGEVALTCRTVPGRRYAVRWSDPWMSAWSPLALPPVPDIATSSVLDLSLEAEETARFFRVIESPSPYDPAWEDAVALRTIPFRYDPARTAEQNGAALKSAIQALVPGDALEIGSGTYSINSYTTLDLQGTADDPIWISAAPGASVIITRPNASQNIINVGVNAQTRYLCLRGLEFQGGSHGVRLYDCHQVWVDQCKVHDTGDVGISANARDTSRLYITRNEIWNTGGSGEGMYLGGNNGSVIMSRSVIALNYVHDTDQGVSQGDGIEVKQGSWGNVIAANIVHDCNYPCILVYGTAGQPPNIVEHNICYRSNDNTMQIQGECIVRNNLVIAGGGSAFASQPHQGNPTHATVVHNTFVNTGTAAKLSAWEFGADMVFANNACYSRDGAALHPVSSSAGVTFSGNVAYGGVGAASFGFQDGTGLADFEALTWDATQRDARPSTSSPLRGAADAAYAESWDLPYLPRTAPHTAGCYGP